MEKKTARIVCVGIQHLKMRLVPSVDSRSKNSVSFHCTFIQSYKKNIDGPGFGIVCVGTSARFQMHSTFENVLPLLVHREREQKSLRSSRQQLC